VCIGKLYNYDDEQFVATVQYQLLGDAPRNYWGELVPMECVRINDSGAYTIELEGNRKCKCFLQKMVNRAVIGVPARFVYRFVGS